MIDPKTFTSRDSRWQDIVSCLKDHGIEVRSPGVEVGDILKKFVVVTYGGSNAMISFSSEKVIYVVSVYVPKKNYSELEPFIHEVKTALEDLRPMVKQDGYESPSFYNDTIKGHIVDIEYSVYRTYSGRSSYYG